MALMAFLVLINASDADRRWITLYIVLVYVGWRALKIFEDYKRQTLQLLARIEAQTYDITQQFKAYGPVWEEILDASRNRQPPAS